MKNIIQDMWAKTIENSNKRDILYRRNYLKSKLLTSPQNIIDAMPKAIGPQFQGEWALYSCSMFTQALANIAQIYPETKSESIQTIHKLIITVMSPEFRNYDIVQWNGEDPLESLGIGSPMKHLSYRSHLAWMICNYKLIGGHNEFDDLLKNLCKSMADGIKGSPAMNLPTYRDMTVYLPDMLVAIVSLHLYNREIQLIPTFYFLKTSTNQIILRENWSRRII